VLPVAPRIGVASRMAASMLFAVLLFAGPHAAPLELRFTPVLEVGAESSYAPHSESEQEVRPSSTPRSCSMWPSLIAVAAKSSCWTSVSTTG
jgi:hypothetical protein